MSIYNVLMTAAKLVERGWTQGSYATNAGKRCSPLDPKADRFCAVGAIHRATSLLGIHPSQCEVARKLVTTVTVRVLPHWNDDDGRTVQQVSQALRVAAHYSEET